MADNTDKDKGQKSDDKTKPNTQGDNSGDSKDDNKDAKGSDSSKDKDAKDDDSGKPEVKFTQADIDRIVSNRLKEEKDRADRAAKEKAAKEKGEFEKLAGSLEAERDDLQKRFTSLDERHKALNERVATLIASEIKALPESIRDLKPESDDVLITLDWLTKAKKSAAKIKPSSSDGDDKADKKPGIGSDPKQASKSQDRKSGDDEAEKALTSRFNYGM